MKPEEKIYRAYFELKNSELYYNQIKAHTGLSHSSLQNALKRLKKSRMIKERKTKSNVFYSINDKKIFALKFSEIAIEKFRDLNVGVRAPLRKFLENLPKEIYTIILFGSASKKEERRGSDIDLVVISNKTFNLRKEKTEAETTSKYPISIFKYTIEQFIEAKDDIIIQAIKTGFPIFKEQNFYEVIMNEHRKIIF